MKNKFLFLFSMLLTFSVSAQKIKVREASENIDGAIHNVLTVTLYGINPGDAEDAFRAFMKKYDGKKTSKEGVIFIDHAMIKEISNNTIDVYGKALGKKGDQQITFIIGFDLGGAFLNSGDHKDQYSMAEKIVKDFAIKVTKDGIGEKLKDALKVQSKLEDAQKNLEKDNKNLLEDIENYKSKIKKAEDDIVKNKSNQEKKKAEIEAQKKAVEEIDSKLKAVE